MYVISVVVHVKAALYVSDVTAHKVVSTVLAPQYLVDMDDDFDVYEDSLQ